jgi:hypothetical protein
MPFPGNYQNQNMVQNMGENLAAQLTYNYHSAPAPINSAHLNSINFTTSTESPAPNVQQQFQHFNPSNISPNYFSINTNQSYPINNPNNNNYYDGYGRLIFNNNNNNLSLEIPTKPQNTSK